MAVTLTTEGRDIVATQFCNQRPLSASSPQATHFLRYEFPRN